MNVVPGKHLLDKSKEDEVKNHPNYKDYDDHKNRLILSDPFKRLTSDDKVKSLDNVFKLYFNEVSKKKRPNKDPDKQEVRERNPLLPFKYPDVEDGGLDRLLKSELCKVRMTSTYRQANSHEQRKIEDRVRERYLSYLK